MANVREIRLVQLLPDSIDKDPTLLACAEAVDMECVRIIADIPVPAILSRVDVLQEPMLSLLAKQFRVLFWTDTLPVAKKRDLIRKALIWRMHHGTVYCVEDALATLYGNGTVRQWFEYGGAPGTFRVEVEVTDQGLDQPLYDQIDTVVAATKRHSQHPDGITVFLTGFGSPYAGAQISGGELVTVYPWEPVAPDAPPADIRFGVGYQSAEISYINPL
ncbi:phage tail protein I [Desulfovibrio mangrovi]|uniref:phage tail protein I n=1 Tax=Desulfovibrio mangrovi TaxID=2976983 RepID=UPI00224545F8|nr:phage tail protein I [Desulfovibrio mangrovi]UZP67645.1 phage tail protein I [Desulfovibrio mangrovi]